MPESGLDTLVEFAEKFTELGGADLSCSLVAVSPPSASIMGSPTVETIPLVWQDTTMVLVDETTAIQDLINEGHSLIGKHLFTVWGGVLDLDTDGETPLGRSSVIVPLLRKTMHANGGLMYGDQLLTIEKVKRGLIIGGVVLEWFIIASGKDFDVI